MHAGQRLSRAHAVLSDSEKRAVYDESGIVDDGTDDVSGGGGSAGEGHWEEYFRGLFPQVTLAKVEAFAKEYRGSAEERVAVLAAYAASSSGGDLIGGVIDAVMCATEDDAERFRGLIDAALAAGEAAPCGDDAPAAKAAAFSAAAKKAKASKDAAATRRRARAGKEAAEAEELLKEIQAKQQARLGGGSSGSGGGGDLVSMIQARNASRATGFDAWADGLEAKYGAAEQAKKTKTNKKNAK